MQKPYSTESVYEITDKNIFDQIMGDNSIELVVLDIYAEWCVPCKILAPKMEELAKLHKNVLFCKTNVELGIKGATSLPTIEFWKLKQGYRVLEEKVVGANLPEIEKHLNALSSTPVIKPPSAQLKKTSQTSGYRTFSSL
jgi:thioredoxin 1